MGKRRIIKDMPDLERPSETGFGNVGTCFSDGLSASGIQYEFAREGVFAVMAFELGLAALASDGKAAFHRFAGLLEIGWPLGLKYAQQDGCRLAGIAAAVLFMAGSGFLLFLAQKEIPMGTAYAVWTGIGAAGAFLVGVLFFNDAATLGRWLGAALIISGVAVMKLSSGR